MPVPPVPIQTEFIKQGFKYTQLKRTVHLALYNQKLIKGRAQYWEVWILRIDEPKTIGDKRLPRKERMPSAAEWGTYAWTFYTREAAEFRYKELQTIQKYAGAVKKALKGSTQVQGIGSAQPGSSRLVPGNGGFKIEPPL
jgi:hypothetical protein